MQIHKIWCTLVLDFVIMLSGVTALILLSPRNRLMSCVSLFSIGLLPCTCFMTKNPFILSRSNELVSKNLYVKCLPSLAEYADVQSWIESSRENHPTRTGCCVPDCLLKEKLQYNARTDLDAQVLRSLDERAEMRRISNTPTDPLNNKMTVIYGKMGLGMTTFLQRFCALYYQHQQDKLHIECKDVAGDVPIISLIAFENLMCSRPDSVGLRILFGTMKNTYCMPELEWREFEHQFCHHINMTGVTAIRLLRAVFGINRRILLGVNVITCSVYPSKVAQQLGKILDYDGNTDIIVTSQSLPMKYNFGKTNCKSSSSSSSSSTRHIDYIPMLALNCKFSEYETMVDNIIQRVSEIRPMQPFEIGILRALPLLCDNLPATIADLMQHSEGIFDLLIQYTPTMYRPSSQLLLHLLSFKSFINVFRCGPPSGNREHEVLLTTGYIDTNNTLVQKMFESNTLSVHSSMNTTMHRVKTTLAGFFCMVKYLTRYPDIKLTGMKRVTAQLFPKNLLANTKSEQLWERAYTLSLVAQSQKLSHRSKTTSTKTTYNTNTNTTTATATNNTTPTTATTTITENRMYAGSFIDDNTWAPMYVNKSLSVKFVVPKTDRFTWSPNTIVVGADGQQMPGWDICMSGYNTHHTPALLCFGMMITTELHTHNIYASENKQYSSIESIIANKIAVMLANLVNVRAGGKIVDYSSVYVVLMVYVTDAQNNTCSLNITKEGILACMADKLVTSSVYDSNSKPMEAIHHALRYVEELWDTHVRVIGNTQIDNTTIPTLINVPRVVSELHPSHVI